MDTSEIYKKTYNLLNVIEEKFPVNTWKIGDTHLWPLINSVIFTYYERVCKNSKFKNILKKIGYILNYDCISVCFPYLPSLLSCKGKVGKFL